MPAHRLPTRPRAPRPVRLAVRLARLGVLVTAAAVVWVTLPVPAGPKAGYAGPPAGPRHSLVQRMLDAHDCSVTGFPEDVVPGSAVVRSATGRLHHVSFETGWRVYTRHGAAQLVAVCRDQPPTARG